MVLDYQTAYKNVSRQRDLLLAVVDNLPPATQKKFWDELDRMDRATVRLRKAA